MPNEARDTVRNAATGHWRKPRMKIYEYNEVFNDSIDNNDPLNLGIHHSIESYDLGTWRKLLSAHDPIHQF